MGTVRGILGTDSDSLYDVRSGAWLTFLLSAALWWIPVVGQMVAGYVGGRRAGSPARGVAASAAGVSALMLAAVLASFALFSAGGLVGDDPSAAAEELSQSSPALAAAVSAAASYLSAFLSSLGSVASLDLSGCMVAVGFGLVGGIAADQARKEIRLIAAASSQASARRHRSAELAAAGRRMGFESFDDCAAVGVNTMSVPSQEPVPEPAAEPALRPRAAPAEPVTATVGAAPSGAVPTCSAPAEEESPFAGILRRTDGGGAERRPPGDDMEYI